MQSGPKYAISKEGLIKLVVLLFGCTTFALLADSGGYDNNNPLTFAFAMFIVCWSISLLFYFFHVIGLAQRMNCSSSCTYDGFDFIWAWISTIAFLAASISFAVGFSCPYNSRSCHEQIASVVLAYVTTILYGVEAFFLRSYAPANVGYIATLGGWLKTCILFAGGVAFSLLVESGYAWCSGGCYDGITYALAAYCIGWGGSVLLFLAKMFLPGSKSEEKPFVMFQFGWSLLCALLFLTASSCFAAYMDPHNTCSNNNFTSSYCKQRLTAVIAGFIAAVLYIVDALLNRPNN